MAGRNMAIAGLQSSHVSSRHATFQAAHSPVTISFNAGTDSSATCTRTQFGVQQPNIILSSVQSLLMHTSAHPHTPSPSYHLGHP